MFRAILEALACPRCASPLDLEAPEGDADPVEEGALRCPRGHRFAIAAGVPRLLPADADAPSAPDVRRVFERQWRHFGRLRRIFGKDRAAMRAYLDGPRVGSLRAPWYRGRVVVDAGCGHGRYLEAFADLGATAIGVDAGEGPRLAGVRTDDPRVHLVQGDVLRLPLRDGCADLAFCEGVLHHTPDPRRGFLELARVVRPGGAVYAWLYPREAAGREAFFRAARAVTTRLPGAALRFLCFAMAPLTALVRSYSGTRFPRATWVEAAQVVHDWLAPRLQSHHTFEEVEGWAREAGLGPVERCPVPVGVVAWKPAAGA